ncbi:hypothetical protein GWI33_005029 [Rhynchophorus ferrugineus]|uniref:Uncharacterized protein n=1 Tax=Rhynchophorus ferrugineus TaxID=354439 RepID=A0A834IAY4_RHYFE|nr:hypothetical protein GWI33_005029 [Rhynchophorus ferrugineus]
MDLAQINKDNVQDLTLSQIEDIMRPLYPEEWENMNLLDKIREGALFILYVKDERLRQKCTLEEFLNTMRHVHLVLSKENIPLNKENLTPGFEVNTCDFPDYIDYIRQLSTPPSDDTEAVEEHAVPMDQSDPSIEDKPDSYN